jgi:signal transduction histidine kinase
MTPRPPKAAAPAAGTPDATILPDQEGAGGPAPESRPVPAAETLRILLVEDSPADVALISHLLRQAGRNIAVTAVDTQKGFEAELTQRLPDLILSDYRLPTFDGRVALEMAKRIAPLVPFIFVTGVLGEEIAIETLKQGATDYVLKSRLSRLAPAVSRALRENEQRRDHDRAEENLRRSHDQLRALTGRLQLVREEERTRIAREVHDELGQALTGIKLDLAWLAGRLPGAALQRKLKGISAHVDATIQAIRRIATELRPGVLDSLGLAAAIEWQAADFQARTRIRCRVKISVKDEILEPGLSTACFRIFQETLTNIIRHAKATRVEVDLAPDGHDLILAVRDNGRGISERDIAHNHSIGLIGMRERAAQVGGEVTFSGSPGRGTTVRLRLPRPVPALQHKGVA